MFVILLTLATLSQFTYNCFFCTSLLRVGASSFQSPRSRVLCFSLQAYSSFIRVFLCNNSPPEFRFPYVSWSNHIHHVLYIIANSFSVCHSHLSVASQCVLTFGTPLPACVCFDYPRSIHHNPLYHDLCSTIYFQELFTDSCMVSLLLIACTSLS